MTRRFEVRIPAEGQVRLRLARGGPRSGAGRKAIGITKKISLTLPETMWEAILLRCDNGRISRSEAIRVLIEAGLPTAHSPFREDARHAD